MNATIQPNGLRLPVRECLESAARFYEVSVELIVSHRRQRSLVRARQVGMWLAYRSTTVTLTQIARVFDRDHTTVIHGIAAVEGLRHRDGDFRAETATLLEGMTG